MNTKYNKKMGAFGETLAAEFLAKKGFEIVARNYMCAPFGEIDLVCKFGNDLIFVEVKTRTSKKFGDALDAISFFKKRRLNNAIQKYLMDNPTELDIRFDVVIIEIYDLKPKFSHLESLSLEI